MTVNLAMVTDAYHMTMGRMMRDPWEMETHVLYARSGGPLVVTDLSTTLSTLLEAIPSSTQIAQAANFWKAQRIPFPADAWHKLATRGRLPIWVRGVKDGEVVNPGDPIALISGPAFLVGALEPYLIGEQMTSLQVATRFTKVATALNWDTSRVFEVGLRAVDGPDNHVRLLKRLKRLGLKATSHGEAAMQLGLKAVGTMGHRFTQRFTGVNADEAAFTEALTQMLSYRDAEKLNEPLNLSFLLDTRDTLASGFPAAMRVISDLHSRWKDALNLSVRLDSGDLRAQFKSIATTLLACCGESGNTLPGIIVESGLTARDVADFEALALETGFDPRRVFYGIGGYLVGGINRDAISLVYKLTAFGGNALDHWAMATPTMKFGDEPESGKESYPGHLELMEKQTEHGVTRLLALNKEVLRLRTEGWDTLFTDLVKNGELLAGALMSDYKVQERVRERWAVVTQSYLGDDRHYASINHNNRPAYSSGVQQLVAGLTRTQFLNDEMEVAHGVAI